MNKFSPAIDQYILKAEPFAKPILETLRQTVHDYCPEATETIKRSFPHFEYKGTILCSLASFKHHCVFGFWLESLLKDPHGILRRDRETSAGKSKNAMGALGRISAVEDLPAMNKLGQLILQAMELTDAGAKLKKSKPAAEKKLFIPEALLGELEKHPTARTVFDNFSYSHKREYVDWLNEAKTATTFNKRLDTTISNLQEGKSKEWKYRK